jgi:hypothetical protein
MHVPYTIKFVLDKYNIPPNNCKIRATLNSYSTVSITAPLKVLSSFYNKYNTEIGKAIQD